MTELQLKQVGIKSRSAHRDRHSTEAHWFKSRSVHRGQKVGQPFDEAFLSLLKLKNRLLRGGQLFLCQNHFLLQPLHFLFLLVDQFSRDSSSRFGGHALLQLSHVKGHGVIGYKGLLFFLPLSRCFACKQNTKQVFSNSLLYSADTLTWGRWEPKPHIHTHIYTHT